eukprot:CAMPEP_0119133490 /NCGR_PEP_ID=MMETSP1310-20130426/13400_1 /TAXON_ID=464262 /ORGANISM="Genus nov. species nov., Strain RCC2339" /LENGTH=159 /DNA_ID=CAMNT_0007124183 /DNA_START=160 /DNA_END=639 /DNA_ORIENTATION=+
MVSRQPVYLTFAVVLVTLFCLIDESSAFCNYCAYRTLCDKCNQCPCDHDPTCSYCKYCKFCSVTSLCDTFCAEGTTGKYLSDWFLSAAKTAAETVGFDLTSIDIDEIDRDIRQDILKNPKYDAVVREAIEKDFKMRAENADGYTPYAELVKDATNKEEL